MPCGSIDRTPPRLCSPGPFADRRERHTAAVLGVGTPTSGLDQTRHDRVSATPPTTTHTARSGPDSFREMAARRTPLPPLVPDSTQAFPFRLTITDPGPRRRAENGAERAGTAERPPTTCAACTKASAATPVIRSSPASTINSAMALAAHRLLARQIGELVHTVVDAVDVFGAAGRVRIGGGRQRGGCAAGA
jgi:hypothetical protein